MARTRCMVATFPTALLNAEVLLSVASVYLTLSRYKIGLFHGCREQVQWEKRWHFNIGPYWQSTFTNPLVELHICAKAFRVEWPNFLTCQKCTWPFERRPEADNWPSLCSVNCADNNTLQKFLAVWLSYQTTTGSNCTVRAQSQPSACLHSYRVHSIGLISSNKYPYPDSALYLLLVAQCARLSLAFRTLPLDPNLRFRFR